MTISVALSGEFLLEIKKMSIFLERVMNAWS